MDEDDKISDPNLYSYKNIDLPDDKEKIR